MAIADDIAKAKNLEALNSKINALQEQMKEAQTSFVQKETQLTKKMDEEIKELFKNGLNNPEIIVESKNDIITGKCGSNLAYSLKISEKERILSRKLDAKEEAYKFRYTFSVHLTGYHGRTLRGTETEEEIKNIDITSMESYLGYCNKTMAELESKGIQIEYFQMDTRELIFSSMSKKEMESEDEKKYRTITIKGLLHLIGI